MTLTLNLWAILAVMIGVILLLVGATFMQYTLWSDVNRRWNQLWMLLAWTLAITAFTTAVKL